MKAVNSLLIADDHPIFRMGLKDILHRAFPKAKIYECHDGAEALNNIIKPVSYTHLDVYKRQV